MLNRAKKNDLFWNRNFGGEVILVENSKGWANQSPTGYSEYIIATMDTLSITGSKLWAVTYSDYDTVWVIEKGDQGACHLDSDRIVRFSNPVLQTLYGKKDLTIKE